MLRQHTIVSLIFVGMLVSQTSFLSGCSSTPPRYPESHARFERIVAAVNTLQRAYVTHDSQATKGLLLPLDTLIAWEEEVRRDFETYPDITLDLSIDRIMINGDLISVQVSWQGEWKDAPDKQGVTARGHGILHWSGTHVILLSGLEGDLPFGMANRQALS